MDQGQIDQCMLSGMKRQFKNVHTVVLSACWDVVSVFCVSVYEKNIRETSVKSV